MATRNRKARTEYNGPFVLVDRKSTSEDLVRKVETATTMLDEAQWQANDGEISAQGAGDVMGAAVIILRAALESFKRQVNIPMLREVAESHASTNSKFTILPREEEFTDVRIEN